MFCDHSRLALGTQSGGSKSHEKKCEGCCLKGSSGSPKAIQGPILQPCSSHCAAILKIWTLFVSSLKETIAEKNGQRQIAANSGKKKQTPANTGQQQPNALCTFSRFFWTSVLLQQIWHSCAFPDSRRSLRLVQAVPGHPVTITRAFLQGVGGMAA